jgi:WXG100 family type VII secretion target
MADLTLTHTEVNAVLADIEGAIKSSDTIMSDLEQTMNVLRGCWEGQAFDAYFAVYQRYKETIMAEFEALMHTYQKTYNDAAVTLTYDDETVSQMVSGSFGH